MAQGPATTHQLVLNEADQIARGVQRWVFRHPHDPTKLIKVLKPAYAMPVRTNFNGRMDRLFPGTRLRQLRKEYQEYLRIMLRNEGREVHLPISHMYGFINTNLGLGCITDSVTEPDGCLATTIGAKAKAGTLQSEDVALLNDAIARIFQLGIRAGDMNASNLVFGHRNISGQPGPRECVLVDGFGDIHAIPIRSWGRMFNRFGLDDSCKRLAKRTGLSWNPATRQFSMKE